MKAKDAFFYGFLGVNALGIGYILTVVALLLLAGYGVDEIDWYYISYEVGRVIGVSLWAGLAVSAVVAAYNWIKRRWKNESRIGA
ncbi:hypothetical protein DRP07_12665 [Archaeoglobales archaeon]|nr:MAG: hypothetical protein DRP07_12665 [Archaeoglobales archaeon]